MYSVDTRKLSCYVKAQLDGRPWSYWLRRFYWFENSIWRLNEIKDLNMGSYDTTKMEFIKVQDMANYTGGQDYDTSAEYSNTDNGTDGEMTLTDPADTIHPSDPGTGTGGNGGGTLRSRNGRKNTTA